MHLSSVDHSANYVVSHSPFLRNVRNASSFDAQLSEYVNTTYVQLKLADELKF